MKLPSIQNYIEQLKNRSSKHKYQWQESAERLSQWFGTPLYWLYHRYEQWKIEDAFRICQEKNIKKLGYLIGILKNK